MPTPPFDPQTTLETPILTRRKPIAAARSDPRSSRARRRGVAYFELDAASAHAASIAKERSFAVSSRAARSWDRHDSVHVTKAPPRTDGARHVRPHPNRSV